MNKIRTWFTSASGSVCVVLITFSLAGICIAMHFVQAVLMFVHTGDPALLYVFALMSVLSVPLLLVVKALAPQVVPYVKQQIALERKAKEQNDE